MLINVYVINDKVGGQSYEPFLKSNEAIALRSFRYICSTCKEVMPNDLDLYYLGTYDTETMSYSLLKTPKFLINGGAILNG